MGTEIKPGEHHGRLVAQYRSYMGLSQQDLADEMRVSLRTVQRMEMRAVIKDPERRRLLVGLLGIPAAYLALDREAASPITKTRLILNDDRMAFYEEQLETNWEVFHLGGTSRAERWIDIWMSNVADFAREARGTAWEKRALAVLCMSYQLKADILGDQGNYIQANTSCKQAFRIAQELDDPELKAAALVRQGVIRIGQEHFQEAVGILQGALDIIKGHGYVTLRGNILQVLSDAYARLQRPQECWRAIGLAESVVQQQTQVRERSQRVFNAASLTAHKGLKALLLHDYDRALSLIDKGLATYDPVFIPRRARFLAKRAEALYGCHEIDACVATAEDVYSLARSVGANRVITGVKRLHADLAQSRWCKERCVRRLGVMLGARD